MLLNKNGEFVNQQTEVVEIKGGLMNVEYTFDAVIMDDNRCTISVEQFTKYPNKNQIMWCLYKHQGTYIEIHKIYSLAL